MSVTIKKKEEEKKGNALWWPKLNAIITRSCDMEGADKMLQHSCRTRRYITAPFHWFSREKKGAIMCVRGGTVLKNQTQFLAAPTAK